MHTINVGQVKIGSGQPLTIIAGPCVAESKELCLTIGQAVRDRCAQLGLNYIFKASYDKANRSSIRSRRGPGLDGGLKMLADIGAQLAVPVTTDIHEPQQASQVAAAVDLLQIPAFLCRQTDLLVAAAETGKPVNVKKGQFISPAEMANVVDKLVEAGGDRAGIMLTERGTFFGYHRLINDFVGLGDLLDLNWPVCFDVTHSTQQPGGQGNQSGGRPERAPLLARCAVAAGVHALFIETHPDPSSALSDAATMLPLVQTLALLGELAQLHQLIHAFAHA
jgi:2-dehydro-3-deoxyphosphooctonate aldolase (KDO 8-P synthase)